MFCLACVIFTCLSLIANILKLWGFYLQTQVSGFAGESGLSRTGDGTGWGAHFRDTWLSLSPGTFLPSVLHPLCSARAALLRTQLLTVWPIQGSFIGVFRMRTHAPSEPRLLPSASTPPPAIAPPVSGAVRELRSPKQAAGEQTTLR